MADKYIVDVTGEERTKLFDLTRKGKASARKIVRAHVLLRADEDATDASIAQALHVGCSTVHRTRQRFVEGGLPWALTERSRRGGQRRLDGKQEAFLVALACSNPPAGRVCWTTQLLADRMVQLQVAETLSDETVRRVLKKRTSSPGRRRNGASRRSAPSSSGIWKTSWICTPNRLIPVGRSSVLTKVPINLSARPAVPGRGRPVIRDATIMSTSGRGRPTCFSSSSPWPAGGTSW